MAAAPGMGTRGHDPRIERGVRAAGSVHGGRADEVRDAAQLQGAGEREAADRHRHLDPVDEGEAFLRAQHDRPDPRAGQGAGRRLRASADVDPALSHQREREVRQRREVARGAHGALAGDDRKDVRREHPQKCFDRGDADARVSPRQRVGPQDHHGSHGRRRERLADACRVAANQVALQLLEVADRNRDVRELAEAGRHAVDGSPRPDGPIHDPPRGGHRAPRRGRQRRAGLPARRRDQIFETQRAAGEPNDFHAPAILSPAGRGPVPRLSLC